MCACATVIRLHRMSSIAALQSWDSLLPAVDEVVDEAMIEAVKKKLLTAQYATPQALVKAEATEVFETAEWSGGQKAFVRRVIAYADTPRERGNRLLHRRRLEEWRACHSSMGSFNSCSQR